MSEKRWIRWFPAPPKSYIFLVCEATTTTTTATILLQPLLMFSRTIFTAYASFACTPTFPLKTPGFYVNGLAATTHPSSGSECTTTMGKPLRPESASFPVFSNIHEPETTRVAPKWLRNAKNKTVFNWKLPSACNFQTSQEWPGYTIRKSFSPRDFWGKTWNPSWDVSLKIDGKQHEQRMNTSRTSTWNLRK